MPHQCTNCDLTFEDGSKQMLGGCPECGGNKFQFLPGGRGDDGGEPADPVEERSRPVGPTASGVTSTPTGPSVTRSTDAPGSPSAEPASAERSTAGAGPISGAGPADDDIIEAPAEPVDVATLGEDRAQASARREIVSEDELPVVEADDAPTVETTVDTTADAPTVEDDRPDLARLRQELDEQFESIKILRPGEYELNLMELYDREEYIIALEEDGRYVINVPDTWRDEH